MDDRDWLAGQFEANRRPPRAVAYPQLVPPREGERAGEAGGGTAPIVGGSADAAGQLASRARRRVQARDAVPDADLPRQRAVVDAFFAAARDGDFDALVAVLDPDVVLRSDGGAGRPKVS